MGGGGGCLCVIICVPSGSSPSLTGAGRGEIPASGTPGGSESGPVPGLRVGSGTSTPRLGTGAAPGTGVGSGGVGSGGVVPPRGPEPHRARGGGANRCPSRGVGRGRGGAGAGLYSGGGAGVRCGAAAMDLHILEHRVRVLSLARRGLWLYTHPLLKLLFLPQRCRYRPSSPSSSSGTPYRSSFPPPTPPLRGRRRFWGSAAPGLGVFFFCLQVQVLQPDGDPRGLHHHAG